MVKSEKHTHTHNTQTILTVIFQVD